jgi:hypothetical protein
MFPGDPMQWMLWTLAINAAAVASVGMLQCLDGTQQLLWTFVNHMKLRLSALEIQQVFF